MRGHRPELFSVEIPVPEDTPQLVRRIERSAGCEAYLGIALNLTDNIDEGRYRVALTRTEARELYTALGDALAKADPRSEDTERDGTHVKVDAAPIPELRIPEPQRYAPLSLPLVVDDVLAGSLDISESSVETPDRLIEMGGNGTKSGLDGGVVRERVIECLDRLTVLAEGLVRDGAGFAVDVRPLDDTDRVVGHGASPSKGDGAEPGLASTVSVEGDPAAGAGVPPAPAVRALTRVLCRAMTDLKTLRGNQRRATAAGNEYASARAEGDATGAYRALLNVLGSIPSDVRAQIPADVLAEADDLLGPSPTRTES